MGFGLLLLAVARGLEMLADDALQMFPHVVEHWQKAAPFPYVGTTALAFLLGPSAALLLNWFYTESMGAMRAVHRDGNSMELLFLKSMESDSLVEITLHSRKVYVGWILNASVAEPERKFVEILPLASGFRSDETHELQFTTNKPWRAPQQGDARVVRHFRTKMADKSCRSECLEGRRPAPTDLP